MDLLSADSDICAEQLLAQHVSLPAHTREPTERMMTTRNALIITVLLGLALHGGRVPAQELGNDWDKMPVAEAPTGEIELAAPSAGKDGSVSGRSDLPADDSVPPTNTTEDSSARPQQKTESVPQPELSPAARALRDEIRRCLSYYYMRPESTAERSPWAVLHWIVGFGVDTQLDVGGQRANAIGWLCWNQPCAGMQLFTLERGLITPRIGPGYQGHEGQFLHMMALSRVPKDFGMKVDGQDLTIEDLIKREQLTCRAGTELTFKLLALVHYLGTEATWQSNDGQAWSIERLLKEELKQSVIGAACGGTHRMDALAYAVRRRELRGEPMTGQWARAKKYVEDYQVYTYKLQNQDGSFSTSWFEGRGNLNDINRKLNTSGHTLEWMLLSLPDDQLHDPQLVKAVEFLKDLLWNYRGHKWEIGPKGHAIHALVLYDERVFGGRAGQRAGDWSKLANASPELRKTPADPTPADPTPAQPSAKVGSAPKRQGFFSGRR